MQRGIRKREHDELRSDYLRNKNTILLKSGSVNGGKELKKRKMSEITRGRTFPSNYLWRKSRF